MKFSKMLRSFVGVLLVLIMFTETLPVYSSAANKEPVQTITVPQDRMYMIELEKDGVYTFVSYNKYIITEGFLYDANGSFIKAGYGDSGVKYFWICAKLTAGKYYIKARYQKPDSTGLIRVDVYFDCNHEDRHIIQSENTIANCIEPGYTAGEYCSNCEEWISGHKYSAINPENHVNVSVAEFEDVTCTKAGKKILYCDACKKKWAADMPYPAHKDFDADSQCDNCNVAMVTGSYKQQENPVKIEYEPEQYDGLLSKPKIEVFYKNNDLYESDDYTVEFNSNTKPTDNAWMDLSIAYIPIYGEDYDGDNDRYIDREICYYSILKTDISDATISIPETAYLFNSPAVAEPTLTYKGKKLINGIDYRVQYINNYDIGTATARIFGMGNFTGFVEKTYEVIEGDKTDMTVLDDINDKVNLNGSKNTFVFNCKSEFAKSYTANIGNYIRIEYESCNDNSYDDFTCYVTHNGQPFKSMSGYFGSPTFNFTEIGKYRVLLVANEDHGSYSTRVEYKNGHYVTVSYWVSNYVEVVRSFDVYVTSDVEMKAPETLVAKEPAIEETHYSYLEVGTEDQGNVSLEMDSWTSSDDSVATVDNGFVTFKKAGNVTITAKKGDSIVTWDLERAAIDIADEVKFTKFDTKNYKSSLVYKTQLLGNDDYELFVMKKGDNIIVTAVGKNLFKGAITKVYNGKTGAPYWCKHTYETAINEPTCIEKGTKNYKCSVCLFEKSESIEALDHSFSDYMVSEPATMSADGKLVAPCTREGCTEKKEATINKIESVVLSATKYTYDGKIKTPAVTVEDSAGEVLQKDIDYTVSYENGGKYPGRYTVKVTFQGKYSGTKELTYTILPKGINKITATQTTTTITLKWTKVPGADGYRVYKYNTKTKKYEKLKDTSAPTLKISKLNDGTAYRYKVRAYKKDEGVLWGKYSNVFETSTKCKTPVIRNISSTTRGRVDFTWSNVKGESGYEVYYSTKKSGKYEKFNTYKANYIKGRKFRLVSGKKYYFKVRAYKKTASGNVYSSFSSIKSIKAK